MARQEQLDVLFAEPSGIVIPFELHNTITVAGRDADVEAGPIVLLLDGSNPEAPFAAHVEHITAQQLEQSDLVVITKTADADPDKVDALGSRVAEAAPHVALRRVDLRSEEGVASLVDLLLGEGTNIGGLIRDPVRVPSRQRES